MNFSIRTMLITVAVLGAGLGIMTKLLIESPETFMGIVRLFSTVVPFVLAIGTLFAIALRRKSVRAGAVCAQCKHDLSQGELKQGVNCPACGADLTRPSAVRLVFDPYFRRRLAVWALFLLLMPVIVPLGSQLVVPFGNPLRALSTQRLIEKRLPAKVEEPWVWRELERRMQAGALQKKEAERAAQLLLVHIKSTSPNGYDRPLSWQRDFFKAAMKAKLISNETINRLCDALVARPVMKSRVLGQSPHRIPIEISYGSSWLDNSHDVQLLWAVDRVTLDGEAGAAQQRF